MIVDKYLNLFFYLINMLQFIECFHAKLQRNVFFFHAQLQEGALLSILEQLIPFQLEIIVTCQGALARS